jgi:hypothetical protein
MKKIKRKTRMVFTLMPMMLLLLLFAECNFDSSYYETAIEVRYIDSPAIDTLYYTRQSKHLWIRIVNRKNREPVLQVDGEYIAANVRSYRILNQRKAEKL